MRKLLALLFVFTALGLSACTHTGDDHAHEGEAMMEEKGGDAMMEEKDGEAMMEEK